MRITGCLLAVVVLAGCGGSQPTTFKRPPLAPLAATEPETIEPVGEVPDVAVPEQIEEKRAQLTAETDPLTRREAGLALAQLGPEGWQELIKGLNGDSPEVRMACLQALSIQLMAAEEGEQVRPILVRMLRDRDPLVRREAVIRLGWPGPKARTHLPTLHQIAKNDADADVRAAAAAAVVSCQDTAVQVGVLLRDGHPLIREKAIGRITQFDMKEVAPWVATLNELASSDPEEAVRQAAEAALEAINNQ